ncbi:MAG: YqcI/YcgG family protein [Rhizobacter sp.]|nr:YqcI/YcgG family protein [Rhizobacter sp.]
MLTTSDFTVRTTSFLQQRLTEFITARSFPCVGAKSALHRDRMRFVEHQALGDHRNAEQLCDQLVAFSAEFPAPGDTPVSLVAMFRRQVPDEVAFEAAMWGHLQAMHEYDRTQFDWDESVGSDPSLSDFSMSIGGRAFFVVGLHPTASRLSRQAPFPCLVFNFHDQFESLKASGKYQTMQAAIRTRDLALQGSINPVLSRFGEASEARQYAGRAVGKEWQCPFHAGKADRA